MNELSAKIPKCSAVEVDALKRLIDPAESSPERREKALEASAFLAGLVLQYGRSVVTETHTRWPEQVERFQTVAEHIPGIVFSTVLVTAPLETCLARASARYIPDIGYEVNEQMVTDYYVKLEPRLNELVINTAKYSPSEGANRVINALPDLAAIA